MPAQLSATYRVQLTPRFGFRQLEEQLPYLRDLGVSHVYLSPITEAPAGSEHGYDVTDHNRIREEFGGTSGFEKLRLRALELGMGIILDIVPNHAGVGSDNEAWQDVLAFGPASPAAVTFDIDWQPLKAELHGKLLLPFLGRPYGEALDAGELHIEWGDGYFYTAYFDNRFRMNPASYGALLGKLLEGLRGDDRYFGLLELQEEFDGLEPQERERALSLPNRLTQALEELEPGEVLATLEPAQVHELLERQLWRLAYWKTAGDEINYRRFFDVNGLVALRMEEPGVFEKGHRLVSELVLKDGVAGVRVDHVDGLVDPHRYLEWLKAVGPRNVWVEKILASGEVLPAQWQVAGTTGYEFMNDVLRLLLDGDGGELVLRSYERFLGRSGSYDEVAVESKQLVMETSLAGELTRLSTTLYRLSEESYRTRDFTLAALREALRNIIASFDRYRTYLPFDEAQAVEVIQAAVAQGKRLAVNTETSVYDYISDVLTGRMALPEEEHRALLGRFQQYTAPVAAKGIEDTAFYRYTPLAALNEVGGEPDTFTVHAQAFHSRARFRAHTYPLNLLATATHDHKRGEDTRLRIGMLSHFPGAWSQLVEQVDGWYGRYWRERVPMGALRVSKQDTWFLLQHLVSLWEDAPAGEGRAQLTERLQAYMLKAVREAKVSTSWISPDEEYEALLQQFVSDMIDSDEVWTAIAPLAAQVADRAFSAGIAQLVLKLTSPGVPDIYQGTELLDLSLVDPDNRRPVDYGLRRELLASFPEQSGSVTELVRTWLEQRDERLKMLLLNRLLRFRRENIGLMRGEYRPLEVDAGESEQDGQGAFLAYSLTAGAEALVVIVPRTDVRDLPLHELSLSLPGEFAAARFTDVLTGEQVSATDELRLAALPLLPAILHAIGTDGGNG